VVRFVVDRKSKEPAILLEELYTRSRYGQSENEGIIRVFKLFIGQHTGLEVLYPNDNGHTQDHYGYSIPISEPIDAIMETAGGDDGELSYRDSDISYAKINKFYDPTKVKLT